MQLKEIKDWSDERGLNDQTPDRNGFNAFITEECGEALEAAIDGKIHGFVDACADVVVFAVGDMYKRKMNVEKWLGSGSIVEWLGQAIYDPKFSYIEDIVYQQYLFLEAKTFEEEAQAMTNMTISSLKEIVNMGFDPDKVMDEVMKEISSRIGAYSEESKKWQKDKSPEAQALWYTADFSNCEFPEQ